MDKNYSGYKANVQGHHVRLKQCAGQMFNMMEIKKKWIPNSLAEKNFC